MRPFTLVVADAEEPWCRDLSAVLRGEGSEVLLCPEAFPLASSVAAGRPQLAVAGSCRKPACEILKLAARVQRVACGAPLILVVGESSEETAIEALRLGIRDYFRPPIRFEDLMAAVRRCLQPSNGGAETDAPEMVGDSLVMRDVRVQLRKIAATDSSVLITGETGTGKELAAQLIHAWSTRAGGPFICVNCAAIPDSLMESELFGHERGAFTGAHAARSGALQAGAGGTVFLDEIGEMSVYAQAKMLRVIETRRVQRLGSVRNVPVDIRIVAATNRKLEELVSQDRFRRDLYFRLNVARLHLASLQDRKEDIPALCHQIIGELNRRFGRSVNGLTDEAMSALMRHSWPGNVRELRNLMEAVFVNGPADWINYEDLPPHFQHELGDARSQMENERDLVLSVLSETNWNCTRAAAKLHWSRMTLYRKMAKYRLKK